VAGERLVRGSRPSIAVLARHAYANVSTSFERTQRGLSSGASYKTHLLFTWLNDLVRHEKIVDAMEDLYGEDLLCWPTDFFIKEASDSTCVSWHQDSTY
jgi:hypothetical protein